MLYIDMYLKPSKFNDTLILAILVRAEKSLNLGNTDIDISLTALLESFGYSRKIKYLLNTLII